MNNNNVWGPPAWTFLHTVTYNYPENPSDNDKKNYHNFFDSLQHVLPCEKCKGHYKQNIQKYDLNNSLDNREDLVKWLIDLHKENNYIVLTGDFNIAPENIDCHDPTVWEGKNLVSDIERQYFSEIISSGFIDSFRHLNPSANDFSWWDYRIPLKRNLGMRIDHILITSSLLDGLQKSYIDKTPRELERPSDHTPVISEL